MGMQVTAVGSGVNPVPQQELPQDRGSVRLVRVRTAELKSAALERFEASLPGNHDPKEIDRAMVDLEKVSVAFNRKLKFVVDHQSNEVTVKVIDPETDKVIKVLPPEELQRLHSKLKETIGFLFDERV